MRVWCSAAYRNFVARTICSSSDVIYFVRSEHPSSLLFYPGGSPLQTPIYRPTPILASTKTLYAKTSVLKRSFLTLSNHSLARSSLGSLPRCLAQSFARSKQTLLTLSPTSREPQTKLHNTRWLAGSTRRTIWRSGSTHTLASASHKSSNSCPSARIASSMCLYP